MLADALLLGGGAGSYNIHSRLHVFRKLSCISNNIMTLLAYPHSFARDGTYVAIICFDAADAFLNLFFIHSQRIAFIDRASVV